MQFQCLLVCKYDYVYIYYMHTCMHLCIRVCILKIYIYIIYVYIWIILYVHIHIICTHLHSQCIHTYTYILYTYCLGTISGGHQILHQKAGIAAFESSECHRTCLFSKCAQCSRQWTRPVFVFGTSLG